MESEIELRHLKNTKTGPSMTQKEENFLDEIEKVLEAAFTAEDTSESDSSIDDSESSK